jgi:hypothetical protein
MDKSVSDYLLDNACVRLKKAIQANSGNRRNLTIVKKSATMYIVKRGGK